MKKIFFFLVMSLGIGFMYSQPRVSLEHNGNSTIFVGNAALVSAYNAAADGDVIFLTGGTFDPIDINKKLTIYGAGVYPSATTTTGKTYFNGSLGIYENADDSHIEGIEIMGTIGFVSQAINNVVIKRCKINSDVNIPGSALTVTNLNFTENILLGSLNIQNATTSLFANNIVQGQVTNSEGNVFANNVFLYSNCGYYDHIPGIYGNNSLFINNVFTRPCSQIIGGTNNFFIKNIFMGNPTGFGTNPSLSNNFMGNVAGTIFINQTGDTFNFDHNYHLQNPTAFLGTDGTEVGLYGGTAPFKELLIPENPHISVKNINTSTNTSGELQVELKAEAQSR